MKAIFIATIVTLLSVSTTQSWAQSERRNTAASPRLTIQQWIQGDGQNTTIVVKDYRWMAGLGARDGRELLGKIFQSAAESDDPRARQAVASYAVPGGPYGYCEYDVADALNGSGDCGINFCKTCYNDFTHEWLGTSCTFFAVDPVFCD